MNAPSNANTSGLSDACAQEEADTLASKLTNAEIIAASWKDRATAAEARADRLAKDTKGLLAEIASFGRAFMGAQESLASTSTPDAYDDAILAASVRYQSMVKTASALYRAALQQETQP